MEGKASSTATSSPFQRIASAYERAAAKWAAPKKLADDLHFALRTTLALRSQVEPHTAGHDERGTLDANAETMP